METRHEAVFARAGDDERNVGAGGEETQESKK